MLGSNSCQRLQLLLPSCRNVGGSLTHLHFLQKEPIFFSSYSSKSSLVSGNDKLQEKVFSFTVSCLINSCGLSPKLALSASKSVQFDNREGPDSVLNVLRNHGFSDDHISQLVRKRPKLLSANAEKTVVPKLEFLSSVGLSGTGLFRVLHVISLTDALTWDQKMEVYKKCGWTEDDFLLAFRKNPFFMSLSCKKFSSKMDFLMMGWQPADVARNPSVLTYSLEKWIIPRCSVIRVLLLKGLIVKGEFSVGTIMIPEKYFLDRFVIRYQEQVPELLHIFQGKIGIVEHSALDFRNEVE